MLTEGKQDTEMTFVEEIRNSPELRTSTEDVLVIEDIENTENESCENKAKETTVENAPVENIPSIE